MSQKCLTFGPILRDAARCNDSVNPVHRVKHLRRSTSSRKLKAQCRRFTGAKREMGDGETAVGKKRDNPGRSLELSHLEPPPRGIHPGRHQHLNIAGWIDTLHDPKAVPARPLAEWLFTAFYFELSAMFQALPQALLTDYIRGKLDLVGHGISSSATQQYYSIADRKCITE